ncbi:RNase P/MRP [Salix suchowensis]|nr:RNase P/MRP [Salix suchowensis]
MAASTSEGRDNVVVDLYKPLPPIRSREEGALGEEARKKAEKERIAGVLGKKGARSKGVWRLDESQANFGALITLAASNTQTERDLYVRCASALRVVTDYSAESLCLPSGARECQAETVLNGPHIELDLYGNQFRFRAADRAGRKFKPKETIEL